MSTLKSSTKPSMDALELAQIHAQTGEVIDVIHHDAVFGAITQDGPNYRNVGWLGTTVLMVKTQIGLGVLTIPFVFNTVGLIPGVILLLVIAGITTWSDYIVGVFKLRHRHVYSIEDVGEMLFGHVGREIFGFAFCLLFILASGSAMLSISIALNTLSTHAVCTAVFVAIAAIVTFAFSSIQTMARMSWLAWIGASCILTSVMTVTIAVGLQDRPAAAPSQVVWVSDYKLFNTPTFVEGISSVCSLIFAYAGTSAFFPIVAEMRDPRKYTRALLTCQIIITVTYVIVGVVVYYFCGSYVSSPALGSAGVVVKKVGYGIALPGLLVTSILLTHIPAKHVFVRLMRGSKHLAANTTQHWLAWLGSTLAVSLVAYLIASSVPVFDGLVSLTGALLGTFLSFQPMGCMWLYDNWAVGKETPTLRWRLMVLWSIFVILSGSFLMVAGTYSSIVGIIEAYRAAGGTAAWSCANNSGSS